MPAAFDLTTLADQIKRWGRELGLQQLGITATELGGAQRGVFQNWI